MIGLGKGISTLLLDLLLDYIFERWLLHGVGCGWITLLLHLHW